jgi:hypothetical protein
MPSVNVFMSEPGLAPDLVAYLLEHGCIAYTRTTGEITALIPELGGPEEVNAISGLAARWRFAHPLVDLDITR